MAGGHALLRCGNARLVEARREAWEPEYKSPGRPEVLLSTPRWGCRLFESLEISGVGRAVEAGAGEEERRATRLGGWIALEAEEWVAEDL